MGVQTRTLGLSLTENGGGGQSNWSPLRHDLPQLPPRIARMVARNGSHEAAVAASNGEMSEELS
jgi:hypothetical protein